MEQIEEERFLKLREVLSRIGMGRTKIYEMINAGEFPAPIRIGKSVVWPNSVVSAWQQEMMKRHGYA